VPIDFCLIITTANFGGSPAPRDLSRRLIFVTAHAWGDEPPELDWSAVADPAATLAPWPERCPRHLKQRIAAGLSPGTALALIHGASLGEGTQRRTAADEIAGPRRRVVHGRLDAPSRQAHPSYV